MIDRERLGDNSFDSKTWVSQRQLLVDRSDMDCFNNISGMTRYLEQWKALKAISQDR